MFGTMHSLLTMKLMPYVSFTQVMSPGLLAMILCRITPSVCVYLWFDEKQTFYDWVLSPWHLKLHHFKQFTLAELIAPRERGEV